MADAVEVPVKESAERWTEIQLEDGTNIRTKSVVISVVRLEGQFDPDGNPMYQLRANQLMIVESPEHLKRGPQDAKGKTAH